MLLILVWKQTMFKKEGWTSMGFVRELYPELCRRQMERSL